VKFYQIPYLKGVVKDIHPRLIPEYKASDVNNILFKEQAFQPRWGYATFGGNLPLNGAITGLTLFRRNNGDQILCAFTKRDAYYYEQGTGLWKYFTRVYITGTVTISAGTLDTVTGSGTTWDNTNWSASGVYQIKFGTTDPNSSTGTWYTVDSVDSNTQITLTTDATEISGEDYVLRLCFSGTDTDYHSVAYPYDATTGTPAHTGEEDKILVVANGIDEVQYWSGDIGTDYLELLENTISGGDDTPVSKYVNFFGSSGFGHTILSNIIDEADPMPQRIYTSDSGKPFQWDGNYYDFFDSQDEIVGIKPLQDQLILYKKETMTQMWINVTGGNSDPFDFRENKIRDIGTPSIRTVHEFGSFHIFLGWDNVYIFDGVSVTPIGTDLVNNMIRRSNRAFLSTSFALPILAENLYCLFLPTGDSTYPDTCFVYNYREKFWTIWDLTHTISETLKAKMTAPGYTYKEDSDTWAEVDTAGTLWDEISERWIDLLLYEDNMSYLLGDSDGYVYNISPEFTDDELDVSGTTYNEDIECSITTKDYPLNDPKHTIKIVQAVIGLTRFSSGSLRIKASTDFGTTWSDWVTIPNTAEVGDALYVEHIANFMQRGRQVRFTIENIAGADFEIESILVGFNEDSGRIVESNT
jgi:hypothetical protein